MTKDQSLTVAFDTAADIAGVALFKGGALLAETTWLARQSHSRQLLPAMEELLSRTSHTKEQIGGVAVCLGPGSYAGLRVGLSTAKALAFGLEVPLAGVGRLAADACFVAKTTACRVVAVHAAGRAELAWAVYESGSGGLREVEGPLLGPASVLIDVLRADDIVVGDAAALSGQVVAALEVQGARFVEAQATRVVAVGTLGLARLARGEIDNPDTLVPLYLRAPAIGPQR